MSIPPEPGDRSDQVVDGSERSERVGLVVRTGRGRVAAGVAAFRVPVMMESPEGKTPRKGVGVTP